MKRFLVLSAVLSVSAIADPIGICAHALSSYVGNACQANFRSNGPRNRNSVGERQGGEMASPVQGLQGGTTLSASGDESFDNFAYAGSVDASNVNVGFQMVGTSIYPTFGVENQSNFSLWQGASGQLIDANSWGPAYTPEPGTELGSPALFAPTGSIFTTSTLAGSDGTGAANPGLSSFEVSDFQASAVVPEPASFALIVTGLFCLGLLRKRATPAGRMVRARN